MQELTRTDDNVQTSAFVCETTNSVFFPTRDLKKQDNLSGANTEDIVGIAYDFEKAKIGKKDRKKQQAFVNSNKGVPQYGILKKKKENYYEV